MRISREEFLLQLESVQAGLTTKDTVEQSSCFAFKDGKVLSFSKDVACTHPCLLKKFEGAVQAAPLLEILQNLDEENIEVEAKEGKFIIYGDGGRKTRIPMEDKVNLPINVVEKAEKWHDLPDNFTEAINMVQHVAGTDEKKFALTCIHIGAKYVEALDIQQIARYRVPMEVPEGEQVLVQRKSIKHIIHLGMSQYAISPTWLHFRNKTGLELSCRRFDFTFPTDQMSVLLKKEGTPTSLPKGLIEAIKRASIFSKHGQSDLVEVTLESGKLRVRGRGTKGTHTEPKKVSYDGKKIIFMISPGIFSEMVQKHNEAEVSEDMLKVKSGRLTYLCSLRNVSDKPETNGKKKKER